MGIYIFDKAATDFSTMGMGALKPISCTVHEKLNGDYSLEMEHPLDGVLSPMLAVQNIIVAPVPAGITPEVNPTGGVRRVYRINCAGEKLPLRAAPSAEGRVLGRYKKGKLVTLIDNSDPDWYRVSAPDGAAGYMNATKLVFDHADSYGWSRLPSTDQQLTRPQPFRIYKVVPDMETVHVYARHIFYDLADNLVLNYKPAGKVVGAQAFTGLFRNNVALSSHDFKGYSDLTDILDEAKFEAVNRSPSDAIMGDKGLIETYGGELFRDWYDVYLMERLGEDRGVTVMYGLNLLEVGGYVNLEKTATRIVPIGTDEDGKDLYLPEVYIESEHAGEYDHPRYSILKVSKAKISDDMTRAGAYEKMRRAANRALTDGADLSEISITVSFVDLAQTVEYEELSPLLYIHPFDAVLFQHRGAGLAYKLRMTEYDFNCIAESYVEMTLGSVQESIDAVSISPRLIKEGSIGGEKIVPGTIGGGQLMDDIIAARHVKADSIYTDALQAGAVVADKIAAGAIDAEKIAAGVITADKLVAGIIAAGSALIQTGAIGTAQIADGSITAAKVVSLNADVINAGTLSAERLLLIGEGGVIYELNAAAAGLTASQLTDAQYKSKLNGTVIVAKSITAEQIAAAAITANEIAAGAITASKIDVADLFAAEATIAAINAMDIRGNEYLRLMVGGTEVGGRNYILNSDSLRGENFSIVGGSGGGVFMDGTALVILYGVTAAQSGNVLSIS